MDKSIPRKDKKRKAGKSRDNQQGERAHKKGKYCAYHGTAGDHNTNECRVIKELAAERKAKANKGKKPWQGKKTAESHAAEVAAAIVANEDFHAMMTTATK